MFVFQIRAIKFDSSFKSRPLFVSYNKNCMTSGSKHVKNETSLHTNFVYLFTAYDAY